MPRTSLTSPNLSCGETGAGSHTLKSGHRVISGESMGLINLAAVAPGLARLSALSEREHPDAYAKFTAHLIAAMDMYVADLLASELSGAGRQELREAGFTATADILAEHFPAAPK